MRKLLGLAVAIAALLAFSAFVVTASAGNNPSSSPPGQDPCSHGNTGKDCRPDPQPDNGKDCEHHGKKGGVNEDHCGPAHPPTSPPVSTMPSSPKQCPAGYTQDAGSTSDMLLCTRTVTIEKVVVHAVTKTVYGKPKCPKGFKSLKSKPGTALCVKTKVKNKVKYITKVRVVKAPQPAYTK